ncbi:hypothetical protein WKH56_06815 [Priestia sp. SB1]|uniref:hypothetical protein n=1 Tax=Priestia sp. SB1 TaxID=3132359 RepID=UPI0031701D20
MDDKKVLPKLEPGLICGEWKLLERFKGNKENGYAADWFCKCSCGTEKRIKEYMLKSGSSKSCGCLVLKELRSIVGTKFGRLVVRDVVKEESSNNWYAVCDCECGKKNYKIRKHNLEKKGALAQCKNCSMKGIRTIDLTGQIFGYLTVTEQAGKRGSNVLWECKCVCGNKRKNTGSALTSGDIKSCGCKKYEEANWKKHGQYGTPLYTVWNNMMSRCFNENNQAYHHYGGRGIIVCDEWQDVKRFIEWCEGSGYKEGLQLDRKDTNGKYEPSNCRFITKTENQNNTRASVRFKYNGQLKTRKEIIEIYNISLTTSYNWEKKGKLERVMLYE